MHGRGQFALAEGLRPRPIMTTANAAPARLSTISSALEAEGYTCREWKGKRVYVKLGARDLGYLTADDDGSTGTCRNVKRSGEIAAIIRAALAA